MGTLKNTSGLSALRSQRTRRQNLSRSGKRFSSTSKVKKENREESKEKDAGYPVLRA